jgi:hypothetical protein
MTSTSNPGGTGLVASSLVFVYSQYSGVSFAALGSKITIEVPLPVIDLS